MPEPTLTFTPVHLKDLTQKDQNRALLWVNKGRREYGVYSHSTAEGAFVFFGMNTQPLWFGFETTNEFYLTEIQ